jgi:RHS repeat-associated protein
MTFRNVNKRHLIATAAVGVALVVPPSVGFTASDPTSPPAKETGFAQAAAKKKKCKKKKRKAAAAAKKKKCKKKKAPAVTPPAAQTPPSTPPVTPNPPTPPPPPFADPLDPTIATSMADSARFLYEGDDAVQQGVAPGTIDEVRVAVLRGRVTNRAGVPLAGVTVKILDHPELGSTETRSDGAYDLAVNGGGPLVLTYEEGGFLPIERRLETPWQDYVVLDDVAMTQLDSAANTIQSNGSGLQVARSSVVSDNQGSRRVTMIFKPGTTAQITLQNGSQQPLAGPWTVRGTEYTVGGIGPEAMPAPLPPTSGYTFAAELSIDQAIAAGAQKIDFNNPVSVYVENFIEAPVGMKMPSGFHVEGADGRWIADPDGRVMKMVGVTGGMAELDIDGNDSGAPESPAELAALGIDAAERTQLAQLYSQGQEFWRVPTTHFSEVDHNTQQGLPAGAGPPPPTAQPATEEPTLSCGSIISCEDQTLREGLPVNGTPFSLFYASDRVPGRIAEKELDVRVTGASPPAPLQGISVQASIAGRLFEQVWVPPGQGTASTPEFGPNLHYEVPWDGTDVYGRAIQGRIPMFIRTTYYYDAFRYDSIPEANKSFGSFGAPGSLFPLTEDCAPGAGLSARATGVVSFPRTSNEPTCYSIQRNERRNVGAWDIRGIDALGGWSLDVHHGYDPNEHSVHRGDGIVEQADLQPLVRTTVAGAGATNFPAANGGSARAANIDQLTDHAIAPDGTLYLLSLQTGGPGSGGLRRVEPDGTIFEVANDQEIGLLIANGSIAVDEQERVYVAGQDPSDTDRGKVVRVDPNGTVTPIAGSNWNATPAPNDLGDDGPATAAKLMQIFDLTMGTDGSLYIADRGITGFPLLARVRKIDPTSGLITSAAGGGNDASANEDLGAGEPASQHSMEGVWGIAFSPDGEMYAAMSSDDTVVKVGLDGTLTRFAGTGTGGNANEGFPPLNSPLETPADLAVSGDGTVYIRTRHLGSSASALILAVADGRVTTVGGQVVNPTGDPGDGSSSLRSIFRGDRGLTVAPDGTIYARDHRFLLYKITPRFEGFGAGGQVAASEDGTELWAFDEEGRHTKTVDAVTGTTLYTFTYDSAGRLIAVVDRDNRMTVIVRDGSGKPTAIVAPGGARTELDVNANGYATQIRDSAGVPTQLSYSAGGLLTNMTDRRGGQHSFSYNGDGLLTQDDGPGASVLNFTRNEQLDDITVTKTTGAGRQTTYRTRRLANGDVEQTQTLPSGGVNKLVRKPDGTRILTAPDGTQTTREYAADPRLGLSAPFVSKEVVMTPGGRTTTRNFSRTATLSNPNDPFSFTTLTDTSTVDGRTSTLTYTKATRRFQRTSPVGRQNTIFLNARDRVVSETNGAGRTPITTTYDPIGRPTNVDQGSLHEILTWDGRDRQTSTIDAAGRGESYGYDGADNLSTLTDGEGGVAHFAHDGEGDLTGVTEANGLIHSLGLDGYGQLTGYTPPGGAQQTIGRNSEGDPSSVNQGAGHTYTFSRDAGGRVSGINAGGVDESSFTYQGGTLRPATANADRAGTAQDQTLAIEWDGDAPTKFTYGGGASAAAGVITLTYDGRGNLTQRKLSGAPDPDATTNLTYDNDDLLTADGPYTFTRGGALGETTQVAAGATTTALDRDTGYDGIGRPTTVTATVGGTGVFSQTHTYDNGGLLATLNENVGGSARSLTYSYDDAGRLTGVGNGGNSESYGYDSAGNRTSRSGPATSGSTETATYDAQGRLDTRGGLDYTFDAAGYLTQRGADTFNYGPQGRLLSANVSGVAITYAYDGLGRRTSRTDSGGTERYLYGSPDNPWQLTASRDPAGVLTQYFYDPDGNLTGIERGGNRFYVFTDRIGSPRLVTNSTGATVKRITYDAFGDITTDTNPGFALRVGFAGGLKDPTSGLVLFGTRDYEPDSGRFTSRDKILFEGGQTNLYAYVANDPINSVDPSGGQEKKAPYKPPRPPSHPDPKKVYYYEHEHSWYEGIDNITFATHEQDESCYVLKEKYRPGAEPSSKPLKTFGTK